MILSALKVLLPTLLSFIVGILITPYLTSLMYKYKMWKRKSRSCENTDDMSLEFKKIHNHDGEVNTPRVGGIIVWLSILLTIFITFLFQFIVREYISYDHIIAHNILDKINFFSRNQTALIIVALIAGSIFGLIDDLLQIYGKELKLGDGISRKTRIFFVLLIAGIGAYWFYVKLGMNTVHIPFGGDFYLGFGFVFLFLIVTLAIFSGGVIDGIDGLAAGVMIPAFMAYTLIAFSNSQYDLAALGGAIIGGLLAFLWFNIPPARFYLGETGMLGLTIVLSMFAFLTNEVVVLAIIGLPLLVTSASSSIQMFSKKYFKRKIFRIAPLHHHFQAIGWSSPRITMRYWIISIICSVTGIIVALLG
jgi:phospho-N-acetylmuramoyl-pentapeptide-transferase